MYDILIAIKPNGSERAADILRARYPNAIMMRNVENLPQAIIRARQLTYTSMYWIITDDVAVPDTFDLEWQPEQWDKTYPHAWQAHGTNYEFSGIYLIPSNYKPSESEQAQGNLSLIKPIDNPRIDLRPYDVFFISYFESNAAANLEQNSSKCRRIQHVANIDGISAAHKHCATLSTTDMFWTIDGDSTVIDGFDLNWRPVEFDKQYLHLWYSFNPCNGLIYGYAGIKLWPRSLVLGYDGPYLDYTTSIGKLKLMPTVASTTHYNTDSRTAWRSGFREAVKLARQVRLGNDKDSLTRLFGWLQSATSAAYSADSCNGAAAGISYFLSGEPLDRINDFGWFEMQYDRIHGTKYRTMSKADLLKEIAGIV